MPELLIPDGSLLAAARRAHETRRADRLIDDPFAARLAGSRGGDLYAAHAADAIASAVFCLSIAIVDQLLQHTILEHHIHTIADLMPGLDPRPYRLEVPSDLRWVQVDRDPVHAYEALRLANATPCCQFRRVGADLAAPDARAYAAQDMARDVTHGLVLTSAGFHDLTRSAMADLIARVPGVFTRWILAGPARFVWPGLPAATDESEDTDAPSAEELLAVFEQHGWLPIDSRALEEEAVRLAPHRTMPLGSIDIGNRSQAGVWLLRKEG